MIGLGPGERGKGGGQWRQSLSRAPSVVPKAPNRTGAPSPAEAEGAPRGHRPQEDVAQKQEQS